MKTLLIKCSMLYILLGVSFYSLTYANPPFPPIENTWSTYLHRDVLTPINLGPFVPTYPYCECDCYDIITSRSGYENYYDENTIVLVGGQLTSDFVPCQKMTILINACKPSRITGMQISFLEYDSPGSYNCFSYPLEFFDTNGNLIGKADANNDFIADIKFPTAVEPCTFQEFEFYICSHGVDDCWKQRINVSFTASPDLEECDELILNAKFDRYLTVPVMPRVGLDNFNVLFNSSLNTNNYLNDIFDRIQVFSTNGSLIHKYENISFKLLEEEIRNVGIKDGFYLVHAYSSSNSYNVKIFPIIISKSIFYYK